MTATENPDPLQDPTQAAEWLHTHPKTLANQRSRGEGPDYVRIGGRVRYRTSALEAYAEARTVKTADTARLQHDAPANPTQESSMPEDASERRKRNPTHEAFPMTVTEEMIKQVIIEQKDQEEMIRQVIAKQQASHRPSNGGKSRIEK